MQLDDDDDYPEPWQPAARHNMTIAEARESILATCRAMFSYTPEQWARQVRQIDQDLPGIMGNMLATAGDDPNGGPPALH